MHIHQDQEKSRRLTIVNVGEDEEQLEPSHMWNANWYKHFGNYLAISVAAQHMPTSWSSNFVPRWELSTYVHWCKNVPTAVAKNWRQFKFTEEWINRSGYIHTMQDYTAIKKKNRSADNMDESHRRNASKKNKNKRIHVVWSHLHDVQEQVKLIWGNKSELQLPLGGRTSIQWEAPGGSLVECLTGSIYCFG